jgi:predicted ArsR family transcriptional regulator
MALDDDIETLSVFTEPQRRRVFEQVQLAGAATVNQVATALGIGRTLVTFHLGKLIEAGFVEQVASERAAGAVGRPAMRYRPTGREVVASVPDRRYDLLAGVLLDSVAEHRPGESAHASALRAARRRGARIGAELRGVGSLRSKAARFARLERLLVALGYAPHREAEELTVRNCPFEKFRESNPDQVCSLNQALSDGYLEGLGLQDDLSTELRPCPDTCCVVYL